VILILSVALCRIKKSVKTLESKLDKPRQIDFDSLKIKSSEKENKAYDSSYESNIETEFATGNVNRIPKQKETKEIQKDSINWVVGLFFFSIQVSPIYYKVKFLRNCKKNVPWRIKT
jgi:hypothetical protein